MPTDTPIAERCMVFGGVDKDYMEHITERKITDSQWLYLLDHWTESFNDSLQYAIEQFGAEKIDDAIEEMDEELNKNESDDAFVESGMESYGCETVDELANHIKSDFGDESSQYHRIQRLIAKYREYGRV
jgi:hypothetical protein